MESTNIEPKLYHYSHQTIAKILKVKS